MFPWLSTMFAQSVFYSYFRHFSAAPAKAVFQTSAVTLETSFNTNGKTFSIVESSPFHDQYIDRVLQKICDYLYGVAYTVRSYPITTCTSICERLEGHMRVDSRGKQDVSKTIHGVSLYSRQFHPLASL